MKKIIFKSIVFLVITVLINIFYLMFIQRTVWDFKKSSEFLNLKNQSLDCIVLGNSVALDGIDTGYLSENGLSSYNSALGGANIKSSFIQLSEYLNNNNPPKIVMLGLSPEEKYNTYQKEPTIHPIVEYNYNLMNKFCFQSIPMVKFQWLAVEPFKRIISKDHKETKLILGQLQTKKTVPDKSNYKKELKSSISIDDYKGAKYLFKIDSLCNSKKIKFYVLGMPGYKKTQNSIPLGLHVLKYGDNRKLNLINLNNKEFCSTLFDSEKDWLGNSHLNVFGAKKLTQYIYVEYLSESKL